MAKIKKGVEKGTPMDTELAEIDKRLARLSGKEEPEVSSFEEKKKTKTFKKKIEDKKNKVVGTRTKLKPKKVLKKVRSLDFELADIDRRLAVLDGREEPEVSSFEEKKKTKTFKKKIEDKKSKVIGTKVKLKPELLKVKAGQKDLLKEPKKVLKKVRSLPKEKFTSLDREKKEDISFKDEIRTKKEVLKKDVATSLKKKREVSIPKKKKISKKSFLGFKKKSDKASTLKSLSLSEKKKDLLKKKIPKKKTSVVSSGMLKKKMESKLGRDISKPVEIGEEKAEEESGKSKTLLKKVKDKKSKLRFPLEKKKEEGPTEKVSKKEEPKGVEGKEEKLVKKTEENTQEEKDEKKIGKKPLKKSSDLKITTFFDKLVDDVEKRGAVGLSEIAETYKIDKKTAQEWAEILKDNDLVDFNIPPFGEPELRKKRLKLEKGEKGEKVEDKEKTKKEKPKKKLIKKFLLGGSKKYVVMGILGLVVIISIASFFIFSGRSGERTFAVPFIEGTQEEEQVREIIDKEDVLLAFSGNGSYDCRSEDGSTRYLIKNVFIKIEELDGSSKVVIKNDKIYTFNVNTGLWVESELREGIAVPGSGVYPKTVLECQGEEIDESEFDT
ncbi:MAG: hypothetical protein ABIB47_03230 [Candidatus Woesearchaeota archaeon]